MSNAGLCCTHHIWMRACQKLNIAWNKRTIARRVCTRRRSLFWLFVESVRMINHPNEKLYKFRNIISQMWIYVMRSLFTQWLNAWNAGINVEFERQFSRWMREKEKTEANKQMEVKMKQLPLPTHLGVFSFALDFVFNSSARFSHVSSLSP